MHVLTGLGSLCHSVGDERRQTIFFSLFYLFACAELLHFRLDDCNRKVVKWKSIVKSRSSRFRAVVDSDSESAAGICFFFRLLRRRTDRRLSFLFSFSFFVFSKSRKVVLSIVSTNLLCVRQNANIVQFSSCSNTQCSLFLLCICWIFNFPLNLCIGLVIMRWRRAIIYAIHCPSHYRD